jgi:hypothetical protein
LLKNAGVGDANTVVQSKVISNQSEEAVASRPQALLPGILFFQYVDRMERNLGARGKFDLKIDKEALALGN